MIICTDCNSHNVHWGSTNNNDRGDELLEFILSTNMEIANIGNKPTFINAIRQEVLDITLVSLDFTYRVNNWTVLDKDMLSDHRPIQFEIHSIPKTKNEKYRNVKKTNWTRYIKSLEQNLLSIDENADLDTQTEQLNTAISKAYEKNCIPRKKNRKKITWWTNELTNLKREYKFRRAEYFRNRTEENRIARNKADAKYTKELKKTQRESWRQHCENLEHLPAVAKLHRVMKNGGMTNIGTLKKIDNTCTTNATETLNELINRLIPDRNDNIPLITTNRD